MAGVFGSASSRQLFSPCALNCGGGATTEKAPKCVQIHVPCRVCSGLRLVEKLPYCDGIFMLKVVVEKAKPAVRYSNDIGMS